MKKIVTLLAFLAITIAARAQKVTERDLQGSWKLVSYKDPQVTIDAIKGTYTLDAEYKKDLTATELKEEEHNYTIMAKQYKVAVITFSGNNANQVIGEESYGGTYRLETYDKVTEIIVTTAEGDDEDPAEVSVKDGMLYLTADDEMELVYKKQ